MQSKSDLTIQQRVDRIISSGQLSRLEHLSLASALLAEKKISDQDRSQINRVFDHVRIGRLKLVD